MIVPLAKFYNPNPTIAHQTGDIWSQLPTYGLLNTSHLSGIVITPACDLANNKVETITYLPILPIIHFLNSKIFLSKVQGEILNLAGNLKLDLVCDLFKYKIVCEDILVLIEELNDIDLKKQNPFKLRVMDGLKILNDIYSNTLVNFEKTRFISFFGEKKFDEILERIITNSFGPDISFTPPDYQDTAWSLIKEPSLILFRYPFTAPIEIFDLAQVIAEEEWSKEISNNHGKLPFAKEFSHHRPMKVLTVNTAFLHDILTRFTILYTRLGAPNFTEKAFETFKNNIK